MNKKRGGFVFNKSIGKVRLKHKNRRRHKSRCIYILEKSECKIHDICKTSSGCKNYTERELSDYEIKSIIQKERIRKRLNELQKKKKEVKEEKPKINTGINVGDTFEIKYLADGFIQEYEIVQPERADLIEGRISHEAPLAEAVIGRQIGEVVRLKTGENVQCKITDWTPLEAIL